MNKFLFVTLCGLIIYAPLPLGANRIWASSSIEFLVFLIFLLHLIIAIKNKQSPLPPKYSLPVLLPLSVTLVWLQIQMLPGLGEFAGRMIDGKGHSTLSFDPSLTHIMFLKTLAFTLYAWMLFYHVNTKQRLYRFSITIIVSGLIQAIYAIWLNLNEGMASPIFSMPYAPRAQGSFVYPNQLANYLALCLSIGIGILMSQLSLYSSGGRLRHKLRDLAQNILSPKIIIRLGLIIMVIGLILTRSRMGNSAFFIALAVIGLFAFFFYNRKPKHQRALIISFFIVDLVLIGSVFGIEKVKQRLVETTFQSETRDEVVRDSIPIIADYPFAGTGGGSFYSTFPRYHPEPYPGFYDHAHNDYIQFAVELGLPASLMLGVMVLYCLFICLKTMRKRKTPLYQGLSFGCAVAIVHMLLHSTVDFSLQSPAVALLFIGILSISIMATKLTPDRRQR
ncbi:MAG: O-antigen polymerase [Moraxellaceae bacterium]|nr:MAG: O-antigen polymerase [Moraxellaceae bacterium]